jgi:glucose/arabinose dehydrogenase
MLRRRWLRFLLAAGGIGIAGIAACNAFLPERLAVNAPLRQLLLGRGVAPPAEDAFGSRIQVPPGFQVGLWAEVPGARVLRPTGTGDLLVSVPRQGRVVLLASDRDGDGRSDGSRILLDGLDRPHGLDLRDGWLYVAEGGAVSRVRFDAVRGAVEGELERVVDDLPRGGNHWTRTLRFGPDDWMYVSVGSSCNVCVEEDPRRAALLRFRPDGSQGETYADGLRNAVGFDWRPGTRELYATDNGRDLLGDDFPPCELNRVVRGGFYGWPVANGRRVPDPDLGGGEEQRIAGSIPPAHEFRAHNAPLGIHFVGGEALPARWRGAALVALHGSWNRTRKDGYKVVSLHWGPDGSIEERDFLWGFLEDEDVVGRPVDVAEGADGALYVSDDYAGAIYRVSWGGDAPIATAKVPAVAPAPQRNPLASLPASERASAADRGRSLYERYECASCHDPERASPGVVPVPLEGLRGRYDIDGLASYLATPTPPMPAFPLSDQDRRDLAITLLSP